MKRESERVGQVRLGKVLKGRGVLERPKADRVSVRTTYREPNGNLEVPDVRYLLH